MERRLTVEKSEIAVVARYMATAPVDLKAIFAELDVEYHAALMDGASGSISRNGDKFTVTVNILESENRQRFTAAHELAHYLLHRDLLGDGKKMHRHVDTLFGGAKSADGLIFKRSHEVEANRLAAQIVMPKKLVESEYANTPDAGVLATKFGVSKAAMDIRIQTLGLVR